MRWMDMWHAWERRGDCTGFSWGSLKGRDHLEDQGVDGRMEIDLGRGCGVDSSGSG
jgi:hypothetical protein